MTPRPEIRKDRDTGKWTATRFGYGFNSTGLQAHNHLPSHAATLDWVYHRDTGPGSVVLITERSYADTDGIAAIPAWTPLYPSGPTNSQEIQ